ncbi:MAG: STAS/SEC14 domain-containing protein [Myxococcales bacterium]|nr:STAS/SEC14 domain-containing protein [Myxococcales bacterium]
MIGGHRVWREGDLVGMHFHGPLTRADFTAMRTLFAAVMAEHGYCYMISDMTHCTAFEPEARKFLGEWSREGRDKVAGTAVYGVNFAMRALVTLVLNATKLISKGRPDDLAFVKDEAEARRWIARRRVEVAAGAML